MFLMLFTVSLSLGVKEVFSLQCYQCYGFRGDDCSSFVKKSVTCSHEAETACYYWRNEETQSYGCAGPGECRSLKDSGCNIADCEARCCSEDLCNHRNGIGDEEAPCTAGLDIGIVLDKSRGIRIRHLNLTIQLLGNLIGKFNPSADADHFGMITFNRRATLAFDFANATFYSKEALLARITNEPLKLKWGSRVDRALEMARVNLFNVRGGEKPDKPNVMMVLTDGKPSKLNKDNFKTFAEGITKQFQQMNVTIIAVGIGKSPDQETLKLIAGSTGKVFQVADFAEPESLSTAIKAAACSAQPPVSPMKGQ